MIRCDDKLRLTRREINQLTTLLGKRPTIQTTDDFEEVIAELKGLYFGVSAEEKLLVGVIAKIEADYRLIL